MINHPNRGNYRYLKVSPRGFDNEIVYYRVPLDKIAEADAEYLHYEDSDPQRYATWTTDKRARMPGVAVDWADRDRR